MKVSKMAWKCHLHIFNKNIELPQYLSIRGVLNKCEITYVMHMIGIITEENKKGGNQNKYWSNRFDRPDFLHTRNQSDRLRAPVWPVCWPCQQQQKHQTIHASSHRQIQYMRINITKHKYSIDIQRSIKTSSSPQYKVFSSPSSKNRNYCRLEFKRSTRPV
jgi:hypothetical protein